MKLECRKCLIIKDEEEFYRNRNRTKRDGRDAYCKKCRSKDSKRVWELEKNKQSGVRTDDNYIYM